MKYYFISLICVLSLCGLAGCKKIEAPLGIPNNTDKTQADKTDSSDLNSNTNLDNVAIVQGKTKDEITTNNNSPQNENYNTGVIEANTAEKLIKPISDQVITALKNKDMETLATYIHPLLGVRFTPYTYVSTDQNIVFGPEKIKSFFQDNTRYQWGNYESDGDIIELTPSQYYQNFVYSKDFIKADQVGYNTILAGGNTLNNLYDIYTNPIVVEYYFPGFDTQYEGLDWQSLSLVFQEYNNTWYLVGIIHNGMAV